MMKTTKKAFLTKTVWNRKPAYYLPTTDSYKRMSEHFAYKLLAPYLNDIKSMLEVGCGNGSVLQGIQKLHSSIEAWGIDVSTLAIKEAKKKSAKLHVQVADAESFSLRKKFDLVFSFFTFEHLDKPEKVLRQMVAHTSPGGYVYIVCPNYGSPIYPSPCYKEGWLKRFRFSFVRDLSLFSGQPEKKLRWSYVDPIVDPKMSHVMDHDTTVEPYLYSLHRHIETLYPQFEVVRADSGWWSAWFGQASVKYVIATIPLRLLSLLGISPFRYWGPRCMLLLRKKIS